MSPLDLDYAISAAHEKAMARRDEIVLKRLDLIVLQGPPDYQQGWLDCRKRLREEMNRPDVRD